ncbi:TetR family transcriptional regulator [Thioalbus denitrificans]|uniref:TetR family transcriptional regulator n=1 Tax=Thioalbus denitrificans TaxID=547122 RepID=A0A369CH27_9GAMM|nr:TetR family transcriptional regulator [Thioalbus denitrificans]RCX31787.1 TetR family transcriptional regulator [Thioalbus denitrificans]
MARKTRTEADRTRRVLLDSALELFRRQGVVHTTLNQIAANAGMTRGAVYWHFRNKEEIILALWALHLFPLSRHYRDSLRALDPEHPARHFRTILSAAFSDILGSRELGLTVRILLRSVEFSERQTELQRVSLEERQSLYWVLVGALEYLRGRGYVRTGLPVEILAGGVLSYLHGLLDLNLSVDSPVCLVNDIPRLLDLFLDGILRPEPEGGASDRAPVSPDATVESPSHPHVRKRQ